MNDLDVKTGLIPLNPIYSGAWEALGMPAESYHYGDPDKVEATGAVLTFPCLFRLLRMDDMITSDNVSRYYTRRENFLVAVRVDDFPGTDEEEIEDRAIGLALGFLRSLQQEGRISFGMPGQFRWFRRDLQQFCICLSFAIDVRVRGEQVWC